MDKEIVVFNDALVIDMGMMQIYCDIVKGENGQDFKNNLYKVIEMSKNEDSLIDYAASNAIQILNNAGYSFGCMDLSHISIPKANL